MFGRPVRTSLGEAVTGGVDYEAYERRASEQSQVVGDKWNERHRAKHLCELKPGDKVWVMSPVDKGEEGEVVAEHGSPRSYWVRVGNSVLRRNRKHLFLLAQNRCSSPARADNSSVRPLALVDFKPGVGAGTSDVNQVVTDDAC